MKKNWTYRLEATGQVEKVEKKLKAFQLFEIVEGNYYV
jgi:hypothetical protein